MNGFIGSHINNKISENDRAGMNSTNTHTDIKVGDNNEYENNDMVEK